MEPIEFTLEHVLEVASDEILHRMGLQALTYGSTVEGFGLGASGRVGDPWGSIKQFRAALRAARDRDKG